MKRSEPFRFKRFSVNHSRSSMKVGVDGVLLGCWADTSFAKRILDVGTGCGVIALICAQRVPEALVTGIDIHKDSVEEASANFAGSPFRERLQAMQMDFMAFPEEEKFDCIVSNPPYFDSGVSEKSSARINARHRVSLGIADMVGKSSRLLTENGRLSLILPSDQHEALLHAANLNRMAICRLATVKGTETSPVKRIMAELRFSSAIGDECVEADEIAMMAKGTEPTPRYRELTADFYLNY